MPGSRMRADELAYFRIDHVAPAPAAEDAVVAGALDGEMALARGRYTGTQLVRGLGLAGAGDVVELALDGEQRAGLDRLRRDAPAADLPQAARQQMFLEHDADGVEVVLGGHVEHGVVFVVEAAVAVGVLEVAAAELLVEIPVRHEMPAGIHGDESGVLQETRIHP